MGPRPAHGNGSTESTGAHVRQVAVEVLNEHLPLVVEGDRYTTADVYQVLLAAAVPQRSLERVGQELVSAPRANPIRYHVAEQLLYREDLDTLEAQCHALVTAYLPDDVTRRPQRLAMDLTLLPYYGRPAVEVGELRRGEAKAGTTRFHAYATADLVRDGRRLTLALTYVRAEDELLDVVLDLLARVQRLGIPIARLYLDREFATVAILQTLQGQPFPSIVALPKRGQRLQARRHGRASFATTDTMESASAGAVTFPLWVAGHYAAGRGRKPGPQHGIEYQAFAVVGPVPPTLTVRRVAREYRQRFGLESSYRLLHQVRARTTSRSPAWRRLLVALAGLLVNLWVWLKATLVLTTAWGTSGSRHHQAPSRSKATLVLTTAWGTRQAARQWLDATLRLDCWRDLWRDLLREALLAHYGVRDRLVFPFPLTTASRVAEY